ncbi:precorrin-2 dehydrogenase/sirohydrochlorin ferrochelatase family protein [Pyrobaculum islandicum]|uniref:precorrin-2 dehydrogenase/sirohydrochlorin ferrochelatase family protein n=1 Tax=Pyrobaculum islandicum TaxID=2277 RepID=UPI00069F001D|nr:bifunctional precorrin-2 dehydrogenase/sirohydrochlorin ferrochelatase [Pyrobaculum islandicum]
MRIPLWVEASRLKVLILGGGSVGTRRAKYFHTAGAKVRVIARDVTPELKSMGVEIKYADLNVYEPAEDIKWADIVVIAVDDQRLAEKLFRQAEALGKLINDATDATRTHVVVPYEREIAGLRVAVTSEGAAGTPARLSLDIIEGCIKESWIPVFYSVYRELKNEAKTLIKNTKTRLHFYQKLVEDEKFMKYVKEKDEKAAIKRGRELLHSILNEEKAA